MASVYRKTEKGLAEIETRAHRLPPRLRTALIMVDGHRTDEELTKLIALDADMVLTTLLDQGFIEVLATLAPKPPPRPPAAAPAAGPAPSAGGGGAKALEERKRMAVRFLNDHLGPSAESLALKIEKATDWNDLKNHLEMAEHFLRSGRGASTAQEFAAKFIQAPPA